MRRTEVLQGIRLMKFTEILDRTRSRTLSQSEAASVLGVSERTFRRWRDRFEADGVEGLYDRRLGRASARRVPVDTMMAILELFDTRYWDFTAKHFHEKLVEEHGFTGGTCSGRGPGRERQIALRHRSPGATVGGAESETSPQSGRFRWTYGVGS